ncbi:transposable element Tcb1 transposase [Trichonephila clavipes]|nr:transposable element Tcb1 transposase [Trichonephila clavipes]
MWVAERNEVVFTDESRICLQHHDGWIRVWRHHGERMLNNFVMHRHTSPAPSIMVWGGIGYHSRTPLVRIAGRRKYQCPYSMRAKRLWPLFGSPYGAQANQLRQSSAEPHEHDRHYMRPAARG